MLPASRRWSPELQVADTQGRWVGWHAGCATWLSGVPLHLKTAGQHPVSRLHVLPEGQQLLQAQ